MGIGRTGSGHPDPWRSGGRGGPGRSVLCVTPQPVTVVDPVGAGDAFQAAFLASLYPYPDPRAFLRIASADDLSDLPNRAAHAASLVCTRRGVDLPDAAELGTVVTNTSPRQEMA